MVSYTSLILPIGVATLIAWIASILVHMLLKWHDSDYQSLTNEPEVADAIRNGNPKPGMHNIPYCIDMKEMGSPEMQKKYEQGPVALLTVFQNGMPPMPKLIGQQVAYFLVGMFMVGYCARLALAPGADYYEVFRVVSATAFLAFGWAMIPMAIWFGHRWTTTLKYLGDALIYGLLTAGVFAWLWPGAT
ncbi:MAG: hypothetical protein AAAFM81_08885 [Pseudomonadota bacterium]